MSSNLTATWARIDAWLAAHAPQVGNGLNPPATLAAIEAAEAEMGVRLPEDLRASFLVHDGQRAEAPALFHGWEWLSLDRMLDEWRVWKSLLDGQEFGDAHNDADGSMVRTDWWHPAWIPLTYSGGGDHHCVDLAPGPQGCSGQIIEMWHDDGARPVVASSFAAWWSQFADDLEAQRLAYSEDYDALVNVEDLE